MGNQPGSDCGAEIKVSPQLDFFSSVTSLSPDENTVKVTKESPFYSSASREMVAEKTSYYRT